MLPTRTKTKTKLSSASSWLESTDAIAGADAILAGAGLGHGSRRTRTGSWSAGERVKPVKASGVNAVTTSTHAAALRVVTVSGWQKLPWLRAGFSTRAGGVSTVYSANQPGANRGDLNLGWATEDPDETVATNRRSFVNCVAGDAKLGLATIRQVHSPVIRIIEVSREAKPGPLQTDTGRACLCGDALMTDVPGILLGIQTADCIPVLVVDTKRKAVAAFHAGWRGTLARIVERGIGTMRLRYGSRPEDLLAAIGPGIGACCYAVSEEVRFEFESQFAYGRDLFSEVYDSDPVREKYPLLFLTARAPGHSNIGPQIHLNLWEANRRQLLDAGLNEKNITVIGECTGCAREKSGRRRYFSHRMEHGFTGRMLNVIGIDAS